MPIHPVIEQLAQLVRDEPSMTVNQLAAKLGYAEQKSVYYWLEKAGFRSIRTFRNAVLTGRFPPADAQSWPAVLRESESQPDGIDIMSIEPPGRTHPTGASVEGVVHQHLSTEGFAFMLSVSDYVPLLLKGELLLVEPSDSPPDGALVLVWSPQEDRTHICRHHRNRRAPDEQHLYHPVTGRKANEDMSVLGLIVGSLRMFR